MFFTSITHESINSHNICTRIYTAITQHLIYTYSTRQLKIFDWRNLRKEKNGCQEKDEEEGCKEKEKESLVRLKFCIYKRAVVFPPLFCLCWTQTVII